MSDVTARFTRTRTLRWVFLAVLALLAIFLPALVEVYWLKVGALVFATSIGAIGLMLLFGRVGQLSLGHPFFLAIGAYAYVLLASPSGGSSEWGLGVPSLLALPIAVIVAALVGLALSPIAARLKGLSLGLATLSLVFIGLWLWYTLEGVTGGINGRTAPALEIGPLSSMGSNIVILGLHIGAEQFVWYVTVILLALVAAFTVSLLKGRVGRAFTAVRDAEMHAGALGVEVGFYRSIAFMISSAYAGLAGALLVIVIQYVTPDYWSLILSLSYLAMIVIGGMRSVAGAIIGALFVTMLPELLQRYGDYLPGVGTEGGTSGLGPAIVAQLLYGIAVILVLIFEPQGVVALLGRLVPKRWRGKKSASSGPAIRDQTDEDVEGVTAR